MIGSVLLVGFEPSGSLALLPTIGYSLPTSAVVIQSTRLRGTDEAEYPEDRRLIRRRREEKIVLAAIKRFIGVIE